MNSLKTITFVSLLALSAKVQAQISIPVADVGLDVSLGSAYTVTLKLAGTSRSVYVDPFKITSPAATPITGVTPSSITATALWFCLDPLQTIYYNGSGVGGDLVYQSEIAANFNRYDDPVIGDGGGLTTTEIKDIGKLFAANYIAAEHSTLVASALQIAIWEVANEYNGSSPTYAPTFSITGSSAGNFSITSGNSTLISTAQSMLTSLATAPALSSGTVDYLVDGTYYNSTTCTTVAVQDLVGWAPPIPESSNFFVGSIGLLGAAIVFKLRNRKSNSTPAA